VSDADENATSILESLAGSTPIGPVLNAARLGRRWWQGPPVIRILGPLSREFGERVGYGRDRFYAWQNDDELKGLLVSIADNTAIADAATVGRLAALIEPRLTETPEGPERVALADEIARAVGRIPAEALHANEQITFVTRAVQRDSVEIARTGENIDRLLDDQSQLRRTVLAAVMSSDPGDAVAALVQGPLKHAGLENRARRAAELADGGHHADAADELTVIAAELAERGLDALGEAFLVQAADALQAAGRDERATDILIEAIWARLDRGQPGSAWSLLGSLRTACADRAPWLADAVHAEVDWPEHGDDALDVLATAIAATDDSVRRARWAATLAVAETVHGNLDQAAAVPALEQLNYRDGGDALVAHLLALSARTRLRADGCEGAASWKHIEDWADTAAESVDAATVWSGRGMMLALTGDRAGATLAYRKAMRAWSMCAGAQEQTAEQLLCAQTVDHLHGDQPADLDLRPLAVAMRSVTALPVNVIERLEHAGTTEIVNENWPDALRLLTHAYALALRSGDLASATSLEQRLARLFAATGRPSRALALAIRAGDGKHARALAPHVPADQLAQALAPSGAAWQRASTWLIVGEHGARLPSGWVAAHASVAFADAGGPLSPQLAPTPAAFAADAVAAMFPVLPEDLLSDALTVVRDQLRLGLVGSQRSAATALIHATNLGRSDETELLIDEMLDQASHARVAPSWVSERLVQRPDLLDRVEAAAAEGHEPALEALSYKSTVNHEVARQATRVVEQYADVVTVETKTEDGQTVRSVEMGVRFELAGLLGPHAGEAARERLVARLLDVLGDSQDAAINRQAAGGALFNLAPALTEARRDQVELAVAPLARGEITTSPWDTGDADPLSRFRVTMPGADELQAIALKLLGRLCGLGSGDDAATHEAIELALSTGSPAVVAGALEAENWLPSPVMPATLEWWLAYDNVSVRLAALTLWVRCHPEGPLSVGARSRLAADPHPAVRHALVDLAAQIGDDALLETLAADEHALIRASAAKALAAAAE
jgi:hypothetical protein